MSLSRLNLLGFILLFLGMSSSANQTLPNIVFGLSEEPEKIGDIKPSFIVYQEEEPPPVSVPYVIKRYKKIFEEASSPEVRIDALNRINNLNAMFELSNETLRISEVQETQAVIAAREQIKDEGIYYDRMDELLYQTAKAYVLTGQPKTALKQLEYLIALYPRSRLADEALFRIAEGHFELGNFQKSEIEYKRLLTIADDPLIKLRSQFKLAWTQYQLGELKESTQSSLRTLDYFEPLRNASSHTVVKEADVPLVADALRLISLIALKQGGLAHLENIQDQYLDHQEYVFLLYDALYRMHMEKERYGKAAVVAESYGTQYSQRADAFAMMINGIQAYGKAGKSIEEWALKEQFVNHYGIRKPFWTSQDVLRFEDVQQALSVFLEELAHLHYVRMQSAETEKEKTKLASRSASRYLELVQTVAEPQDQGESLFLAAEALSVAGKHDQAIPIYERAAYETNPHRNAIEAGFAAIAAYNLSKNEGNTAKSDRERSILTFSERYNEDARVPNLLAQLADEFYASKRLEDAITQSQRVLTHPLAQQTDKYSSQVITANAFFDLNQYSLAEAAYQSALSLQGPDADPMPLVERIAESIYRTAESTEDLETQALLFLSISEKAPQSRIAEQAAFDGSNAYLKAENWSAAVASLVFFQDTYPDSQYDFQVLEKLGVAQLQSGDLYDAARTLNQVSERSEDPEVAGDILFQVAELYEQAGFSEESVSSLKRFVSAFPNRFDLSIEAMTKLRNHYLASGEANAATAWRSKFLKYEGDAGKARTVRSRSLAAEMSYNWAIEKTNDFEAFALNLPLRQSLQQKRNLLNQATHLHEQTVAYGIAPYVNASTYQLAHIYAQLSLDILNSERPKGLSELEREQYDILLEEQAYPFEEEAINLHQINTSRASDQDIDEWMRKSFVALAEVNPVRFKRTLKRREVSEVSK